MIYDLSLRTAGLLAGLFLLAMAVPALAMPNHMRAIALRVPRSWLVGAALLTVALVWTLWLLMTMEMGEFSNFRRPLLVILPIAYFLVLHFVREFLAVRALGILCLLAAEPLLSAAFLRPEASRLLVTVFAYVIIIAGLFWVTVPYVLRDQVQWSARNNFRWMAVHSLALIYGGVTLFFAFTRY